MNYNKWYHSCKRNFHFYFRFYSIVKEHKNGYKVACYAAIPLMLRLKTYLCNRLRCFTSASTMHLAELSVVAGDEAQPLRALMLQLKLNFYLPLWLSIDLSLQRSLELIVEEFRCFLPSAFSPLSSRVPLIVCVSENNRLLCAPKITPPVNECAVPIADRGERIDYIVCVLSLF